MRSLGFKGEKPGGPKNDSARRWGGGGGTLISVCGKGLKLLGQDIFTKKFRKLEYWKKKEDSKKKVLFCWKVERNKLGEFEFLQKRLVRQRPQKKKFLQAHGF